jgi:hypothetical protein
MMARQRLLQSEYNRQYQSSLKCKKTAQLRRQIQIRPNLRENDDPQEICTKLGPNNDCKNNGAAHPKNNHLTISQENPLDDNPDYTVKFRHNPDDSNDDLRKENYELKRLLQ